MFWKTFATLLLVTIFMRDMISPPTFGVFVALIATGVLAAIVDRITDV